MATAPKAATKAPAKGGEEPPPPAAPKKSGKKLVIILVVLLLLLGGGGGAAWFFLGQQKEEAPAAEGEEGAHAASASASASASAKSKEPPKPPTFMVIEPFTVNLQSDGSGDRFLQVAFSLQVGDQQEVDMIKMYMPQVRSRLLLLLSGKKAAEISTPDGKKLLAEEIIAQVKQPFAPGVSAQKVSNVFFTSFVIQ